MRDDAVQEVPAFAEQHGITLSEGMYRLLRAEILNGNLPEGAKLRERDIAQRYNLSRTPVREALRRLLVERQLAWSGKNLIVAIRSFPEIMDALRLREVLLPLVVRLAIERARPEDIQRLEMLAANLDDGMHSADTETIAKLSQQFDAAIFAATHSDVIQRSIEMQVGSPTLMARMLATEGRAAQATEERMRIFQAIRSRDHEAAIVAARQHVENATKLVAREMVMLETVPAS